METARYISFKESERRKKLHREQTDQALREYYANTSNVTVIDTKKIREERQKFLKKYRAFYKTKEWKQLREQVIQEYRANNQLFCIACGTIEKLVVDHINPVKKFWDQRLERTNLHILCNDCNLGKGSEIIDNTKPIDKAEQIRILREQKELEDEYKLKDIVMARLFKTVKKHQAVYNTHKAYFKYRDNCKKNGIKPMDIDTFIKVVRENTAHYFDEEPSKMVNSFLWKISTLGLDRSIAKSNKNAIQNQ